MTDYHASSAGGGDTNVFLTQGRNELGFDPTSSSSHSHNAASTSLSTNNANNITTNPHISQSTRLHHALREMKETDDALALMKTSYHDRLAAVKSGEAKFLVKQHNIMKYLKRFKLFIMESDTKRQRAEKKELEEHRQRLQKIKEIDALRAQFLLLQSRRSDLAQKNEYYKQNKSYLESVKDSVPEQYTEIDEILIRYQILKQTNLDLTEANRLVNTRMEQMSADLVTYNKSSQNHLLVLNSQFASLVQKLERVTSSASDIENDVLSIETRIRDMKRYSCEIQMAIQNIYARTMSSCTSAKAVTQMKKRVNAARLDAEMAHAAATAGGAGGDEADDTSTFISSKLQSSSSTAANKRGSNVDDYQDSDSEDHHGASSNPGDDALASASASAAAAAQSQAAKQHSLKLHLQSRLDAIAERIEDLQDIASTVSPGMLQGLRESGAGGGAGGVSIYSHMNNGGGAGMQQRRNQRGYHAGGGAAGSSGNGQMSPHRSSGPQSTDSSRRSKLSGAGLSSTASFSQHRATATAAGPTAISSSSLQHATASVSRRRPSSQLAKPSSGGLARGSGGGLSDSEFEDSMNSTSSSRAQSTAGKAR